MKEVRKSFFTTNIILGIILIFALSTRIFNLGTIKEMYFDEYFHVFTAREMMRGNPKSWEWLVMPPGQTSVAGVFFEWTHPPLAKLGMIAGMKIFGESPFGWRLPGAVLGTLTVYLVFLIAKNLFDDEKVGLLSALVFALDGLPLVMSRVGLNDTYFLFFGLLSIYLFIIKKDFWSASALGMAFASKWTAIFAIPILGAIWLIGKRKFTPSLLWFLFLPFGVYLFAYLPMFATGHALSYWWELQKQMWRFHATQTLPHPYGSAWWSWPILLRPVHFYMDGEGAGMVGKIYAMGNPFVFWFGLVSVIVSAIRAFAEHNKKLGLVVFSYLVFFVPWALSPRTMYAYHYLPALPFLAIAIGYVLRRHPKLAVPFLVLSFSLFVYFYPHWTGFQIPSRLDESYYWLSSWR